MKLVQIYSWNWMVTEYYAFKIKLQDFLVAIRKLFQNFHKNILQIEDARWAAWNWKKKN